MKRIVAIVAGIVVFLGAAVLLHRTYGIQENVLYNEKLLGVEEKEQQEDSLVTRMQAMEQAYAIFGQGIGVSLLDSDMTMNINLYYDKSEQGAYKWSMTWLRESTLESYSCIIDVMTGELCGLYVSEIQQESTQEISDALTKKEARKIIRPFLEVIGIREEDYTMKAHPKRISFDQSIYRRYVFKDKEGVERFLIEIDESTKKIILFQKTTGE